MSEFYDPLARVYDALERQDVADQMATEAERPAQERVWAAESEHWRRRASLLHAVHLMEQHTLTRLPGWRISRPAPPMVFSRFATPR